MILLGLSIIGLTLSLVPAALFAANLRVFRRLSPGAPALAAAVSVLIPARNEEASIVGAVQSVLANRAVSLELIVLDDGSTDSTAALVRDIARSDPRVRVEQAPPLPTGWCGKEHACQELSKLARHDLLVWIDADVRLAPDALSRMAAFMRQHPHVGLLSGFPRQVTASFGERLLIPLIHFVLLGFLPLARMRKSPHPAFGAGCGQLFMARRECYQRAGGHAAIRSSLHDGIMLPRAFRKAGIATDVFDGTDIASCRMYHSGRQTWLGLAKNATEAMAAPRAIVFWTLTLLGGQVMPWVLLIVLAVTTRRPMTLARTTAIWLSGAAVACSLLVRIGACVRFRQSRRSALLHPMGIVALLAIQWHALARLLLRRPASWKGRRYG